LRRICALGGAAFLVIRPPTGIRVARRFNLAGTFLASLAPRSRPLQTASYRIGLFGVVALVALRLGIGWHFFQEGSSKLHDGNFSSVGFLGAAKGPLAPAYHNLIWDREGFFRLQREDTINAWQDHLNRATDHFGFDSRQQAQAQQIFERYKRQFEEFLNAKEEDFIEYEGEVERRDKYRGWSDDLTPEQRKSNRAWAEVPSLRGQLNKHEGEIKKKSGEWLRTIDTMWSSYENELNALAYEEQAAYGYVYAPRLGRRLVDSESLNRFIPYFDLAIGVLLILGLFTRLASLVGAGFLLSIIVSQYPLSPEATATYYQSIEMFGLFVLAGTAAGRFAGLDYLVHAAWTKCCRPNQES
jgi:uncharacterized membrane protein YphA (DoxX/SURF4 family)